ncbi:hypothetical protein QVD99_005308 [Batrachochytrium dendrobatidis]|nr:hypothetical protein O5D80_004357 [Batrachochytrium dendrobatidis]KAK5668274.1 hypothetical protein QVD99_005308 [Batrachochytrium dendrobatidis]
MQLFRINLYRQLLSLIAVLAVLAGQAIAYNTNCPTNGAFCIHSFIDSQGNAVFTVHSSAQGWAAFGTGNSMSGSSMVIGWINSTNGVAISNRISTGHAVPAAAPAEFAVQLPLQIPNPPWAIISFSFKWAPSSNIAPLTSPGNYIYAAFSDKLSPGGGLPVHNSRGSIKAFDYNTAAPSVDGGTANSTQSGTSKSTAILSSTPDLYKTIVVLHGVGMFVAWGIAPFFGIFIARYLKEKLDVWWYRLHLIIMFVFCFVLTIGSTVIIYLYKTPPHFQDVHRMLGIIVSVSVIIQVIMGFVSNALYNKGRERIPIWDKVHWWFGRLVCAAGAANLFLGLLMYHDMGYTMPYWLPIILGVYFFGSFVMFSLGERYYGKVDHIKLSGDPSLRQSYYKPSMSNPRPLSTKSGYPDDHNSFGRPSVPPQPFDDAANDRYSRYTAARYSAVTPSQGRSNDRSLNRRDDYQLGTSYR